MIRHTHKGQAYLTGGADRALSERHVERRHGPGIRLYFSFLKFVAATNAIIAACGAISWALYLVDASSSSFGWSSLFVGSYIRGASEPYWVATNVIVFVCAFALGPAYFAWERRYCFRSQVAATFENEDAAHQNEEDDVIADNTWKLGPTYELSLFATCAAIASASLLIYVLVVAQRHAIEVYANVGGGGGVAALTGLSVATLMSLPVTLALVVSNALWTVASYHVTDMEDNKTWGAYRKSQAVKLIAFKLITVSIFYTLVSVMLGNLDTRSGQQVACLFVSSGTNFAFMFLFDFLGGMLGVELALPLAARWVKERWGRQQAWVNSSKFRRITHPEFNIAQELLQVMYRQFLLYIGFLMFPMLGVVCAAMTAAQYHIDRYKLRHICENPHYLNQTLGKFMLGYCSLIFAVATLSYPNGFLWIVFVPGALPSGYQNCSMTGAISRL